MQQLLEKALSIAISAHKLQVDKAGEPYILHPIRCMLSVNTIEEKIIAILHDVFEDSELNEADLAHQGFPDHIVDCIRLLTHDQSISYREYITRIRTNPLAAKIKLADLEDNMDPRRMITTNPENKARLEKYLWAYSYLTTTS